MENAQNLVAKKPYFNNKGITLYRDDCIRGMRAHLKTGSVDVVVTSPPYNIGKLYNQYRDTLPREKYLTWMEDVGKEVRRVLTDEGSFFLNLGGRLDDPWNPYEIAQKMRDRFVLQNVIHWVKSIAIDKKDVGSHSNVVGDVAVGHYKPISGKRFLHDCHEYIFHFTPKGKVALDRLAIGIPYQDKSNIRRWKSTKADLRCRGNTWFLPYETIRDRQSQRPHPSSFPIRLPEMCLKLHGLKKTKLVLDPFIGIGSTAIACLRLGLFCTGFDIDENYLNVAVDRISSY